MATTTRQSQGFSLVELMVVVCVFGLLIAIAVPTISGYLRSSRLVGAAHTLEADFHYAHSLAHEKSRTYEVLFHTNSYALVQVSPFDTIRARTLPTGVACAATDTATFYAWGLTKPAVVTMTNSGHSQVLRLLTNGNVTHD